MTAGCRTRLSAALALLAGLAVRVPFVLSFRLQNSGDSPFYIQLALNWLKHGVYGAVVDGRLVPVDWRVPGYPAFLAAVFALTGDSLRAALLAQVVVDLATCALIALMALQLAPEGSRRRAGLCALWLAALCPFTANYAAVVLAETLATSLTALTLLLLLEADSRQPAAGVISASRPYPNPWFLAGLAGGLGALVRPETPLPLVTAALVLAVRWRRPADWPRLAGAGMLIGAGLLLPLLPWAARNLLVLHKVQFLAPKHGPLVPGQAPPFGLEAWGRTWLWRHCDTLGKMGVEPVQLDEIPAGAFDSPQERDRVAALLAAYNERTDYSARLDRAFAELARERTARHPLRTYVGIPLLRSLTMWFAPRIEPMACSKRIFPLRSAWKDDRTGLPGTLGFASLNAAYIALALAGAWKMRRRPGCVLLITFILVRTSFIAALGETPDPRYVLECFPAVIALAAQAFTGRVYPADRTRA